MQATTHDVVVGGSRASRAVQLTHLAVPDDVWVAQAPVVEDLSLDILRNLCGSAICRAEAKSMLM